MPKGIYPRPPLEERFWPKVDKTETCWLWTGHVMANGYGKFYLAGNRCLAHRVAYELLIGPIPDGMTLDHLCRNPPCVRPDHLEPVTLKENIRRGEGIGAINARKTHCPHGHLYDEANTKVDPAGRRRCRTCRRIQKKQARAAKKLLRV